MDLHGFVLFTAASAACGLAPTPPVPVAVRVVRVGGAAMLQASSVTLITTSAPTGRRCRREALGLTVGPVAGGLRLLVAPPRWRSPPRIW